MQSAVHPISRPVRNALLSMGGFFSGIANSGTLAEENRRLKSLAAAAAMYEDRVGEAHREIQRLRALLDLPPMPGTDRLAAAVVAYFPHENRMTLGVGTRQGVRPGQPVVVPEGLAGKIQTADADSSQVLLVSSPRLVVGAMTLRNPPVAGLLRGESESVLILEFVSAGASLDVGDRVMTSGFSSQTPPGIPIGEIVQVWEDPEFGSRRCQVFPNVNFGSLREVYVLR